ncbi:unnamed protein product [Trypanosoma congolense IL3000]|uniref:WGS project CAEQ00000000 data, annotated contig 1678 n=1 Tax=Trypanosoma congolense (strain IL3000) TaxID=1068625 RepID=F9W7Y8_TRYCI|nr:unnamed protein product [Trypanosoma congolense IL3000]
MWPTYQSSLYMVLFHSIFTPPRKTTVCDKMIVEGFCIQEQMIMMMIFNAMNMSPHEIIRKNMFKGIFLLLWWRFWHIKSLTPHAPLLPRYLNNNNKNDNDKQCMQSFPIVFMYNPRNKCTIILYGCGLLSDLDSFSGICLLFFGYELYFIVCVKPL